MTTYLELQEQIKSLQQRAEQLRAAEIQGVIEQLRAKVAEFQLSPEELFGKHNSRNKQSPVPPKYRDPLTGATWSGRGRAPRWIDTAAKNRFLIK